MHIRLSNPPTTAILFAAMAAVCVVIGARIATSPRAETPSAQRLGSIGRTALEQCREHVSIIHDVHWAAACTFNAEDDSPECMLPPDRAHKLNAARSAAENSCVDEAVALERRAAQ